MIREDAENFQAQLEHLFRVFEVNVAVGLHRKGEDWGVTAASQDSQFAAHSTGKVKAQKAKKKDPLSG